MRERMNGAKGYADRQPPGQVMQGRTVSEVVEPRDPRFKAGDRTFGIAGGPEECACAIDELGFAACIDDKSHPDATSLSRARAEDCPEGIDCHFHNVGGMVPDAALTRMDAHGRIAVCGMVVGYHGQPLALANPAMIPVSRLSLQGFIISEHMDIWPQALTELAGLVTAGKLHPRESVAQGLASAPEAFPGMLKGRNFGKQLVRLI
jgi:hypothetical protein